MIQADSVHSTPRTNTSSDTTSERPADSAGEIYVKTPVTPEEAFQAIGRLRKEARDEVDRLIRFLDKTDDYMFLELEDAVDDVACDDTDEGNAKPSLGWTEQEARWGTRRIGIHPARMPQGLGGIRCCRGETTGTAVLREGSQVEIEHVSEPLRVHSTLRHEAQR